MWFGWCFFNTRLVTGKGIKYFENAAKEMKTIFCGGLLSSTEKKEDFALVFV